MNHAITSYKMLIFMLIRISNKVTNDHKCSKIDLEEGMMSSYTIP